MKIDIVSGGSSAENKNLFYLASKNNYKNLPLSQDELNYVTDQLKEEVKLVEINQYKRKIFIHVSSLEKVSSSDFEKMRKLGHELHSKIQTSKIKEIRIIDSLLLKEAILPLLEGISLSNYQFVKYLKDTTKIKHSLEWIGVESEILTMSDIDELTAVCDAVKHSRNLVNEPLSYLTAQKLSEEIKRMADDSGFEVEVLEKAKIESLKMGGLLAVNKGSVDEPRFSILEWKPKNAKNSKPIVFVGKGVVYDTGGLSLKPTKDSMDLMKSDMGGAAAVAGALYAIAKAKLPVHVMGLIPATDNRPGGNAYAPGDIITMFDGTSVEVLNTDAEGRLILADALSYAKRYDPEFVVDLATLTGAAAVAIGKYGVVAMGNKPSDEKMLQLKQSGENTYERIVEFPFWEEYGDLIKSDIADLKNIGGRDGGAITAGKFLEHFTNYPWVHIDIAGPAFLSSNNNYQGKGGTGVGVRLLFDFVKNYQS